MLLESSGGSFLKTIVIYVEWNTVCLLVTYVTQIYFCILIDADGDQLHFISLQCAWTLLYFTTSLHTYTVCCICCWHGH